jgi:hypothetical protein
MDEAMAIDELSNQIREVHRDVRDPLKSFSNVALALPPFLTQLRIPSYPCLTTTPLF